MLFDTLSSARAPSRIAPHLPQDPFEAVGSRQRFSPGEEVFAQDEDADLLYRVLQGSVRSTRLLEDGRRQVGGFYYPGDVFGLEVGLHHRSSAEALDNALVLIVKRSALKHQGREGALLERMVWQATGLELQRVQDHMLLLGRKSALERVSHFLRTIAKPGTSGWTLLSMSRKDIADYLGLTIETVSRMISQLQAEGAVVFDGARRFRISPLTGRACRAPG
ncbi:MULTISPECIES: cyclic nucleotide-binding domain-containing protein [unclassified Caulobacter]|uniref:cyclic nucleotide-binding domain-containing protein n=1 Tax=unclassified Caulobacter TaxID=2648921 RepID=UPI000D341300|nr:MULTISPECIES: cyclic nucleotide-binding domain-containing protein [unclassified Caulobacter]PTS83223.1 Crp/Fnr family transcriptional regulator [Caulobacter sp. HMWF009]PTT06666.1 Crp/Fnr family transcriptional regulator [Caulobacter sp. HMWF025]PTT78093.1 Crp/Fnr family transcriptional regulator [Pseudomonas sp. HMWF010]